MAYHWFGWISVGICILLLLKYIARISKLKRANLMLRKIHKPLGVAVIAVSMVHGIIAVIKVHQLWLPTVTGIILLLLFLGLAVSFYSKRRLKAHWFVIHRMFSIFLFFGMLLHIFVSIP